MDTTMYRFQDRAALIAACPHAWINPAGEVTADPAVASVIELGVLYDFAENGLDADGMPIIIPTRRPGFHAFASWVGSVPAAWAAAEVEAQPGDPWMDSGDGSAPPLPPGAVPQQLTRAQARVAMAAHILPDGRSLLTATRELLTAQQEATAALPDADPQRIAAMQAAEWWTAAATYRRDHPVLLAVAAVLGLTDAEIDALFRAAALISA